MADRPGVPSRIFVRKVVEALQDAGLEPAIGGSGLIAALGLTTSVRDWDVTVDATEAAVEDAMDRAGITYVRRAAGDGPHATRARYLIDAVDHEIDLMVGFAVRTADGVVPISTRVTRQWRSLPVGDPHSWAFAYEAIGRVDKAQLLNTWLSDQQVERSGSLAKRTAE